MARTLSALGLVWALCAACTAEVSAPTTPDAAWPIEPQDAGPRVDAALAHPDVQLRLFGKPKVEGHRRVAVTLSRADDIDTARALARDAAAALTVDLRAG